MSIFLIYYKEGAKMMRPILTAAEYRNLRNSQKQVSTVAAVRSGDESQKHKLLQMNYSCLPKADGSLKGATRMSNTVGMDIDHIAPEEMESVKLRILSKRQELGLLMMEKSARGKGYLENMFMEKLFSVIVKQLESQCAILQKNMVRMLTTGKV